MLAVEGCVEPQLPAGAWIKRYGDEALVGCGPDVHTTWLLTCVHGQWDGHVDACTTSGSGTSVTSRSSSSELSASAAVPAEGWRKLAASAPLQPQDNGLFVLDLPAIVFCRFALCM